MMTEWITEPFEYVFFQKAIWGIVFASINCGAIGAYIIVRRLAFMAEALTHTLLPGVVIAYLVGVHLLVGATLASLITAIGTGFLVNHPKIRQDSAIGIVLASMFALGVLLMGSTGSFQDFAHILFGNIVGVNWPELLFSLIVTIIVLTGLIALHKELELSSYDPLYALTLNMRPNKLTYLLLVFVSLSVVSAVYMMGALLATALLIIPASTAIIISQRLTTIIPLSIFLCNLGGIAGLYLSYYLNIPSGATIVLTCSGIFSLVWGSSLVGRRLKA